MWMPSRWISTTTRNNSRASNNLAAYSSIQLVWPLPAGQPSSTARCSNPPCHASMEGLSPVRHASLQSTVVQPVIKDFNTLQQKNPCTSLHQADTQARFCGHSGDVDPSERERNGEDQPVPFFCSSEERQGALTHPPSTSHKDLARKFNFQASYHSVDNIALGYGMLCRIRKYACVHARFCPVHPNQLH